MRDIAKEMQRAKAEALKLAPFLPGRLVIPKSAAPADPRNIIKPYLMWQDVYPSTPAPSLDELKAAVSRFNCSDLLQSLSKLNVIFSRIYRGGEKLPADLLRSFFEPDAFKIILDAKLQNEAIVPYRPGVVFLQKLTLAHARAMGGETVDTAPLEFGRLLMGATQHAEGLRFATARAPEAPEENKNEILASSFFRNLMFNSQEYLGNQVSRYWAMLVLYPEVLKTQFPDEFFDMKRFFEEETRLDPELYLMFAFSVFGHYVRPGPADVLHDPRRYPIGETFFGQILPALQAKARLFMDLFSRTRDNFQASISKERPANNAGGYDARFIFETPLYKSESGLFFPLDLDILGQQATSGLYWKAHGLLRGKKGTDYFRFKTWWGRLFEWHIRCVLESYLPGKSTLTKRLYIEREDGFEGADFVIHDGAGLVVIEVTTSGIPLMKIVDGAGKDIFDSLDRILFETEQGNPGKAVKLANFIDGFQAGRIRIGDIDPKSIKYICPVFITEQGFPQVNPLISIVRNEVAKRTKMGELAQRLEFWDAEEIESMEHAIKSGISAAIVSKHKEGMGGFPMKNYLHSKQALTNSMYSANNFGQFADKIHRTLFGTEPPPLPQE